MHLAAKSVVVRPPRWAFILQLAVRVVRLGHDHDALARDLMRFEELAEDDLALAGRVRVGRVKCLGKRRLIAAGGALCSGKCSAHVDALVVSVFELADPFFVVRDHPVLERAVLHTAEDQLGHLQPGFACIVSDGLVRPHYAS